MADKPDITQKKTLRLKKDSSGDGDQGANGAPQNRPEPVPAVMGSGSAAAAPKKAGTTFAAIVALLATLLFASLVFIQYRELKAYQYAFPNPDLQQLP